MLCTVTAITPDGRRTTLGVDARSINTAAIEYNYKAVGNPGALIVPAFDTTFEIEAGRMVQQTSWVKVLDWADRMAQVTVSLKSHGNWTR